MINFHFNGVADILELNYTITRDHRNGLWFALFHGVVFLLKVNEHKKFKKKDQLKRVEWDLL